MTDGPSIGDIKREEGDPAYDWCKICSTSRKDHGSKNHEFSEDGKLVPKSKAPARPNSVRVSEPMAARLAAIMLERQLIDPGDFEFILTGRREVLNASDDTDRSDGQTSG